MLAAVPDRRMYVHALQQPMSAEEAARRLAATEGLCWLDADGMAPQGRYSFVASEPVDTITSREDSPNPFAPLAGMAAPDPPGAGLQSRAEQPPAGAPSPSEVPCWAGFISYDTYLAGRHPRDAPAPERAALMFARYDAWFVEDHELDRALVVGDSDQACRRLVSRLKQAGRSAAALPTPRGVVTDLTLPSRRAHARIIETALAHIAAGDIYQVNLAHAWHGTLSGDPLWLALAMRAESPVPFGAYLDFAECQLITRSMERFLRFDRRSRALWSRPIKGTRIRTADGHSDARALARDPKERAEHAMIVDLMRNDLGRVAEIGSVRVEDVMRVEPYRGLHHLVSTVRCRTREGVDLDGILEATFPPGSVTGAPKLRATQIIEALEADRRGPYTGAIGFIDRMGGLSLAVAIRTAIIRGPRVTYHAGGGLVAASDVAREIDETVLKARVFLDAIGADPDRRLDP